MKYIHALILDGDVLCGVLLDGQEAAAFRADLVEQFGRRAQLYSLGHIDTLDEARQRVLDYEANNG